MFGYLREASIITGQGMIGRKKSMQHCGHNHSAGLQVLESATLDPRIGPLENKFTNFLVSINYLQCVACIRPSILNPFAVLLRSYSPQCGFLDRLNIGLGPINPRRPATHLRLGGGMLDGKETKT